MDTVTNISAISQTKTFQMPESNEYMPLERDHEPMPVKDGMESVNSLEARLARARQTANAFEAIFIRQLLQTMRTTLGGEGMFGSGTAGEIYEDMVDNALSETLSERSFLGISDMMYRRLIRDIGNVKENESGYTNSLRS